MSDDFEVTNEKLQGWLDEVAFEDQYDEDVVTPRDWLREAVKNALHDSKRPMGYSQWAYELAVTMVPAFPDIVLDVDEYGDDDIEFTFDWERFEAVLNGALDALINQALE